MIDTILFDLDGTLRTNEPSANKILLEFANNLGVPLSEETYRKAIKWAHFYWAQSVDLLEDQKTFKGEAEKFWVNYSSRVLKTIGYADNDIDGISVKMHAHMVQNYQPENILVPDASETLETLKSSGYKLGLVTNRNDPIQEEIDKLGLTGFFDVAIYAGDVNSWKPDIAIFMHALDKLQSRPEKTVYVGDNYYADIVGARQAGMYPILLDVENIFPEVDCHTVAALPDIIPMINNYWESASDTQ